MFKKNLEKLLDGIFPSKKLTIGKRELRSAGIGIVIHDARWDRLFSFIKKSPSLIKEEESLNSLIKEKTRLHMEDNMNKAEKKKRLARIMELTERAISGGDEGARMEMAECEARVREINEREPQIAQRDSELEREIGESNLALLDEAVSYLYTNMKKSQTRVAELETQITEMREAIKERIIERSDLENTVKETYNFLHGLLGAKQIESLDDHYTFD